MAQLDLLALLDQPGTSRKPTATATSSGTTWARCTKCRRIIQTTVRQCGWCGRRVWRR